MFAKPAAGDLGRLVAGYITEKTGAKFQDGMYVAFAVLNDAEEFTAGVVISHYSGHDCYISVASENGAAWRPHVCHAIFGYIFEQLGCKRVTAITTKGNKKCRAFLDHFGFTLEGNARRGYDGERDALIYGLLASECRYLEAGGPPGGESGEIDAEGTDAA